MTNLLGGRTRRALAATTTTLSAILALAATAHAAPQTFTVNTQTDTIDTNGCTTNPTCSFRDAVTAANAAAGNTVVIPSGFDIKLDGGTNGDVIVTKAMTITGQGPSLPTIDAQRKSRVLEILAPGAVVTIENLTLTGGLTSNDDPELDGGDGGGIASNAALTLTNVRVVGNQATDEGGGIFSTFCLACASRYSLSAAASVTIADSTIAGNQLADVGNGGSGNNTAAGGGIGLTESPLAVTNSTIFNNSADDTSDPGNTGGGIAEFGSTVDLVNTTLNGNTAGDASHTGTGGGISTLLAIDQPRPAVALELVAQNTIVSGNKVGSGTALTLQNCHNVGVTTSDSNVSDDTTCGFSDAGSKLADPLLGPFQLNAPGDNETEAIGPGSPALDAGDNNGCPSTDQRGVARPQNSRCDIGAYEFVPATSTASNSAPATTVPALTPGSPARATIRVAGIPACISRTVSLRIRLRNSARVKVVLNGRTIKSTTKRSFTVRIDARRIHGSHNVLRIIATNSAGRRTTRRITLRHCHVIRPRFTG